MKRPAVVAGLLVCMSCNPDAGPRDVAQPDAAALAAAEANPVYQQRRRQFNELFQSGDYPAALEEAKRAHQAAPSLRDPYIWISTLCTQTGRNQEAIRVFRETAEAHPDLAHPWFYKGFNEFHLGLFEDALKSFERCAELDPTNAETWYRQAMIHYTDSDFDTVSRLLEKSYELDPRSEETAVAWIDVLRIRGDEERASAIIAETLARMPHSAAIVYRNGLGEMNARNDAAAERTFLRAIELDPAMREPYEHLAGLLSRSGREQESRRYRNISTRLNDYSRNSRLLESRVVDAVDGGLPLLLAEVELTAGNAEIALRWFRRALQLGGFARRNAAGQAEALFRLGRIDAGNRVLGAAKEGSSRVLLAQAAREIATGSPALAREFLDAALRRAPNEAQFLQRASDYAARLGDAALADELLERSVSAATLSSAPDPD